MEENLILQDFYRRTLRLYQPQAERLLDTTPPELFNEVSFRYTFSVEAMTKISHIIEDGAIANRGAADLHVSFQYLSRLLPQAKRYAQLANDVKGLWIYGQADMDLDSADLSARTTVIDTDDSLLVRYWFVIAYGPGIGMSLLAEEVPSVTGADRYYEGFYTFEQDIAYQLLAILHQLYPEHVARPLSPEQFGDL